MNLDYIKAIAFGILFVTSFAGAEKTGRVVRRRPINKANRQGKSLLSANLNSRQPHPNEQPFAASEPLPPQFAPVPSSQDESSLSERQGFAFDPSLPPQFSSFPPSNGGNVPINLNEFENIEPFQNVQNGKTIRY